MSNVTKLAAARAYLDERGLTPDRARRAPHVLAAWQAERAAGLVAPPLRGPAAWHPSRARSFTAGEQTPYTYSWTTSDAHINTSLYKNLRVLRARSRDLARNNDYAMMFLGLVVDNVIGPTGIALQVQARRNDGSLDEVDSRTCEQAWAAWGRIGVCDMSESYTWVDLQRVLIRTIAVDGEVLVRRWRGRGTAGYQLQLLDPSLLDETHIADLPNGNRIRMGVELDADDRRVAYHLAKRDVADPRLGGTGSRETVRIPADQIWHLFVPEAVGQLRGVPWMRTTMTRQKRLGSYEDAAVAAAEEGAKKLAWIKTASGDARSLADEQVASDSGDTGPASGTLYVDSGDGISYGLLPADADIANWDPKYPMADYAQFTKQILRGIASGLRVSYHKLASDLENVNYSSARSGELNERDVWKGLQQWFIDHLCAPAYSEWLPLAIVSGHLSLPMARVQKFDAAVWQGRRWDWVDPEKDVTANVIAINNGLTSRTRVIRAMGHDPDEIRKELEREKAEWAGLLPAAPGAAPAAPNTSTNAGGSPNA